MSMTIKINGVETDVPAGAVAWQYTSPVEEARWIYSEDEAREVERDDPSLIVWVGQLLSVFYKPRPTRTIPRPI